jgi:hypothetical protein
MKSRTTLLKSARQLGVKQLCLLRETSPGVLSTNKRMRSLMMINKIHFLVLKYYHAAQRRRKKKIKRKRKKNLRNKLLSLNLL